MPSPLQKIKEQGKKVEKKLKIQTKECKDLEKKLTKIKNEEKKIKVASATK